jgi:cephalosporin hydroxylase
MRLKIITSICCLILMGTACRRSKPQPVTKVEVSSKPAQRRLLRGFYADTAGAPWRWTSPVFAFSLDAPQQQRGVYLEFDFGMPQELMSDVAPVTLIGTVNGLEVGRVTYFREGRYVFTCYVPARALAKTPVEVEFELDRSTTLGDGRVVGLLAIAAGLKRYEETVEFRENRILLARQGYQSTFEQLQRQFPPGRVLELKRLFAQMPAFDQLRFQDIPIRQNPLDLWAIQQILWEVQPEFVLATGTGSGGLAIYLAQTLDGLGLERSRIVSAGQANPAPQALQHFLRRKYVEFVKGEPADPAVIGHMQGVVKGRSAVVLLDAGQTYDGVLEQLRAYGPLVSSGSYMIVQDTDRDELASQPGVGHGSYAAIQKFLAEDPGRSFESDPGREMALFTRNGGGWLRKK